MRLAPRRLRVTHSAAPLAAGAYGGLQTPDVVGNLRVDQTWGSAQVMGAWHLVNASYYNPGNGAADCPPGGVALAQTQWSGHPSDESGWVLALASG